MTVADPGAGAPPAETRDPRAGDGLTRFEGRAMASPLRLILRPVVPAGAAARAWAAVVDEFEACDRAMSRFRDTSEVTEVNRSGLRGEGHPAGSRLRRALAAADRAWRQTDGRFDPRVLEALDRLGYRGAPLGAAAHEGPTRSTDRPLVELRRDGTVRVSAPIDLGGIGKGLALRWAAARATAVLPPTATGFIDAGGDIIAIGDAPPDGPWLIGIEDPRDLGAELVVVALIDRAIATSSVAIQRWATSDGRPAHHLIDPRTGTPGGDGLLSVTVSGSDPAWAEVRSKCLFLEGRAAIGPAARGLGLAAWWVTTDGAIEMTPAARERTVWLAREVGVAAPAA